MTLGGKCGGERAPALLRISGPPLPISLGLPEGRGTDGMITQGRRDCLGMVTSGLGYCLVKAPTWIPLLFLMFLASNLGCI